MGLFSGDMQVHAVVCPATMRNLSRLGLTHPQVKDIAEAYAEEFARYRRNQAERLHLTPVNLTVDTFITAGHTLDPNLASDLYRKMEKHVINAEAIICGRDETGAHLYKIIDPGEAVCFDTTCFVASGSRYDIAEAEFMFARFDKSLPHIDTIFLAYSAKRRAQAAAGVGEDTDLFAIGPNGITQVASEQLADLKKIWEKKQARDAASAAEAVRQLAALIQAQAPQPAESSDLQQTQQASERPAQPNIEVDRAAESDDESRRC
jgi:hypothetical protein